MRLNADATDTSVLQVRHGHNQRLEWGSIDMSLIECYVHTVVPGLGGQIGHIAGAVAVVPTIDGCFAGTLDGHAQTALPSATCVDHKLCRLPDNTTLQSRSESMHLIGITAREAL